MAAVPPPPPLSSGSIRIWGTFRWKERFYSFDGRALRIFKTTEAVGEPSPVINVLTAEIAIDAKKETLFTIDDGAALHHLKAGSAEVRSNRTANASLC